MPTDRTTDFLRELLVRQLTTWLPAALHRSRRATIALAGADAGSAEAALRLVATHGDQVRGRQVTVLVLADAAADLPARLGPIEAELPAEVTVHLLPGEPYRLPVAVKAAGAAGAPLFSFVDLPGAVTPKLLTAATNGRTGELLLHTGDSARDVLVSAGFPLVAEVAPVLSGGEAAGVIAFGSRSDRSLEAVRDALWALGADLDVRYRDPLDPTGTTVDVVGDPDLEPLAHELLAELRAGGPRPVTELRRHTLTATVYRAADANQALVEPARRRRRAPRSRVRAARPATRSSPWRAERPTPQTPSGVPVNHRHPARLPGCYDRDLSCFQDSGPGRSTRCARALEFQDQRPILMLHEEKPFSVKFRMIGPYFLRLRNMRPIGGLPSSPFPAVSRSNMPEPTTFETLSLSALDGRPPGTAISIQQIGVAAR